MNDYFRAYVPMPKLTPDGYRIVIFRIFDSERTNLPSPENIMKATQIGLDISLKHDRFRGMTVIYDLENSSMNFISLLVPMLKRFFALGNVSVTISKNSLRLKRSDKLGSVEKLSTRGRNRGPKSTYIKLEYLKPRLHYDSLSR